MRMLSCGAAGGNISVPGECTVSCDICLESCFRVLLMVMGEKHGQYMGFGQQDAHEFLRQLLDAMRMEELDVRHVLCLYLLSHSSSAWY
jgi:hypothetical protein